MFVKDLTNEQIRQIKEQLEAGEKFGDVVRQFGIQLGEYFALLDRVERECGKSATLYKIIEPLRDYHTYWT